MSILHVHVDTFVCALFYISMCLYCICTFLLYACVCMHLYGRADMYVHWAGGCLSMIVTGTLDSVCECQMHANVQRAVYCIVILWSSLKHQPL